MIILVQVQLQKSSFFYIQLVCTLLWLRKKSVRISVERIRFTKGGFTKSSEDAYSFLLQIGKL